MRHITIAEAIQRTVEHREVFHDEMLHVMRQIMRGELTPAQIAGFIIGLRVKKETIGEIAAAAQVMREFATRVEVKDRRHLVDTCGTGGDASYTFNISTCSAFVAAAAGATVAKHMSRSMSSACGSADVLEALGGSVALEPRETQRLIDEIGLGFIFAPAHHLAMKHASPVRKELGVRTLFNILGPLTNPAGAENQVMGVFHPDLVGIQVRVLERLGSTHVMIVHGLDGLDEISISGETMVGELVEGEIREYNIHPSEFGLELFDRRSMIVHTAEESKAMILAVLANQPGAARNIVVMNAGAAIYVAGVEKTLKAAVKRASHVIESGAAKEKLDQYLDLVRELRSQAVTGQ
jgi:anthranilate phosphoribosyltransferase